MRSLLPWIVAGMFVPAASAAAHDFWIEPSTFRPATGQRFTIGLRVGQDFIGDDVPLSPSLVRSFVIRDAAIEHSVNGAEVRLFKDGVAIIGYEGKPQPLEISAAKFDQFLREEGLEDTRAPRGKPHRELFSRFAKAIVGAGNGAAIDRPFGWRFEIVPLSDPSRGGPVRVRVLLDSKPLAGARVAAIHREHESPQIFSRTDAGGLATLTLPKAGGWQLKCVALVPAPPNTAVEWESLWASLTFER